MPQFPVKLSANINNAAGNSGIYNPLFTYTYSVTGTPAAVTNVSLGVLPCTATYVGCAVNLGAVPASSAVTVTPKKFVNATAATTGPVALNATDPAIASTASVANGPAGTLTITKEGVAAIQHTGATGVTDAILNTGSTVQFAQGDQVLLSTSGTFTSSAGLSVTLFFRDDSGSI